MTPATAGSRDGSGRSTRVRAAVPQWRSQAEGHAIATAASKALPPSSRTRRPTRVASGELDDAMQWRVKTGDRRPRNPVGSSARSGGGSTAGAGLDTFKGGREWRVEAKDFPISATMTGVILELEPGALRELHWHPNADEWQYLLSGRIRVTLFGSRGRYREATLETGDVGSIPQGYGHSLDNIGPDLARILIVFNAGTYQTVDLSQWIAGQPADVLAVNFGKPAATFAGFPKRDVFMSGD